MALSLLALFSIENLRSGHRKPESTAFHIFIEVPDLFDGFEVVLM